MTAPDESWRNWIQNPARAAPKPTHRRHIVSSNVRGLRHSVSISRNSGPEARVLNVSPAGHGWVRDHANRALEARHSSVEVIQSQRFAIKSGQMKTESILREDFRTVPRLRRSQHSSIHPALPGWADVWHPGLWPLQVARRLPNRKSQKQLLPLGLSCPDAIQ